MVTESLNPDSRSDQDYGRIFEELVNEIYVFDIDSLKFLEVNRSARENLGYTAEELGRMTPLDLKPELTHKAFEKLTTPLRDGTKSIVHFEVRHRRKDGSSYQVEVHLQLATYRGKSAFFAIILDVSARQKAAEELHLRNRAIEAACVGIVISDAKQHDNPIIYCNSAFEKITGYSAEEAVGHNCRFLQGDDRSQEAIALLRAAVRESKECRATLRNYKKDGTPFWNELTVSPVHDANQQATHFIGILNDVTARVEAEKQLRENASRLRAILNNAVEAIITIDDHGICESINPAAERLFGYRVDEVVGKNISMLMPVPYRDEHDGYLAEYLRTGEKKIIGIGREVTGMRKDGSEFPLHLSVSEVRIGSRCLFTGIIQDLTEQKEYERRLVQSARLAAVGEAMASVAHESRNLLQKIQIGVELSRLESSDNNDLLSHLSKIERASDGLHTLLEEVRGYAAPVQLELSEISLQKILTEAWEAAVQAHPERQARLIQSGQEKVRLRIDRFRMVRAFRNFFENSLAACSDPVEVSVNVTETHTTNTQQGERSGGQSNEADLMIVIRDNGPGLSFEQKSRIFEPFFTTKSKGTGLGMAIAYKIIEAHGGSLSVGDDDIPGAKFYIHLPRHHEYPATT